MKPMKFLLTALILCTSIATAVPDPPHSKLSPSLRLLRAVRQNPTDGMPQAMLSLANAPELNVTVRFAEPFDLATWESRGMRLRRIAGEYAGSGSVYGAIMTWDEIDRWVNHPDVLMIASDWNPRVLPCLDLSAPEIGATEAWEMVSAGGFPIIGEGQLIADFDTGVDVFHPALFRRSELRYDWIDIDQNGAFTPGTDVVDLDSNGTGSLSEILDLNDGEIYDPAMTFGGNGISNDDGVYQADWDWLYNDANGNDRRDYGAGNGFSEDDPGYGEMVFHCDDLNGNNELDVGEQLILLAESKISAVMEDDGGTVRRRGIDLIQAAPDYNGHGTAVSGVLAGGTPGVSRFCGIAPGADLLMGYYFNGVPFSSYLPWVREEGCRVLLYEFGGFVFQPLDGSSNEELLLDSEAAQGVMQVLPAGNLNRGYKHCQLQVASGQDYPISISAEQWEGADPTQMYSTFLWREPDVELTFSLEDPYANTVDLEGNSGIQYFGQWEVYSGFWVSPRGTAEYDIALWGASGEILNGTWILTVHHPGGVDFELNGNIADDVSSWEGGIEFIDYRSNDKTVTWPATADSAFVLGSYSTRGYEQYIGVGSGSIQPGEISLFSGRGTRIDGVHILSIAAPGNYDVYSTRSEYGYPYTHAGYRQFSGTSAAGPHVAAAAALVMQADPSLTRLEVEQYLEEYALKDDFTGPEYNDTWGHGKLRVAELVSYLDVPLTGSRAILPGSLTLNAYPNPFNASVSLQVQLKNRQTVRLAIFDLLGREVAVIYEGMLGPGTERFTWQAEGMSSGIYWATLESDLDQTAKKVVVLK